MLNSEGNFIASRGLMQKRLFSALFLICLYFPIHAQEIEIGCRFEAQGLHRNYTYINSDFALFPLPTCIQLNAGISPINNLWIEFRGGKEFAYSNFRGLEYGIFSKYFLNKNLYLTAGYAIHSNEAADGHTSGSFSKVIKMPAFGVGIKPWNHVGFAVLFQKLDDISISWATTYIKVNSESMEATSITRVDWLIKLGLTFDWKL